LFHAPGHTLNFITVSVNVPPSTSGDATAQQDGSHHHVNNDELKAAIPEVIMEPFDSHISNRLLGAAATAIPHHAYSSRQQEHEQGADMSMAASVIGSERAPSAIILKKEYWSARDAAGTAVTESLTADVQRNHHSIIRQDDEEEAITITPLPATTLDGPVSVSQSNYTRSAAVMIIPRQSGDAVSDGCKDQQVNDLGQLAAVAEPGFTAFDSTSQPDNENGVEGEPVAHLTNEESSPSSSISSTFSATPKLLPSKTAADFYNKR
jgi:hypothetical protein